ncbi:D-3-phosphoglycerate dehydrogenase-like [Dendronephthya gigantea]|uniref:D-3-phosphoglycerate dehydrogenase-like n=1 Tax=Dendronephthya gigantea TaxID=151771 RepID=UPI00106A7A4B|nr:D-3-phosphoglycerate dehydrogenase-like [Dendronephthya gigantea]
MAFQLKIEKVLISDNLDNCCPEILTKGGIVVKTETKLTKEELLAEIPNYDALIVRSATKVTDEVLEAGKRLKLVGRAGTGVDNIDIKSATRHGVIVMNTPSGNTLSAAEHTCALIVSLARNIPQAAASMREGRWDRKKFMGNELFGKTLGIVGLGRIGMEVATRMQSFGMTTIGYDPLVSAEMAAEFNVEWMELEKLWPLVDYVTVHTPLIPQTKGLLNDKTFAMCKKGVRVINCARGGIIDEECLLTALESGQCAGAGLDVFVTEPPTGISEKVVQHANVISCPHLGASTVEAQKRVAKEIAEQILKATKGESLFGAINAASLQGALQPETGPWLKLGTGLAKVALGLNKTKEIRKVIVTTFGAGLEKAASYVAPSVLMGLIPDMTQTSNTLNLINGEYFAKEMGLQVEKQHENKPVGVTCDQAVSLKLEYSDDSHVTLTGTIFGPGTPTLLQVDDLPFSSPVPLVDKLNLFPISSSPAKILGKLFEKTGEDIDVKALHSSWNGERGITVLKIDSDFVFESMSVVSF